MNPFDIFSITDLGDAINVIPNKYGRMNELNLFPVKGIATRTVAIEMRDGVLTLIPTQELGGPGNKGKVGKRRVITFQVPQLVHEDFISPDEVQDVRRFGGEEQEQLANLVNDKLETCRAKHDITLEHLRMGALKGVIYDADGTTVIYNLFTAFNITQKVVDFVLGTAGTDVRAKCLEVKRHIEKNLKGEVMRSVRCEVSPEFYDKLTNHPKVEAAYAGYVAAAERLGGDMRKGFTFGDIEFVEYLGEATKPDGTTARFIPAGDGRAYPLGTVQTFKTYVAPADFNETVGKLGQIYYAKIEEAKHGRGYDVHTQSNPLPICQRPEVLVRVHSSN